MSILDIFKKKDEDAKEEIQINTENLLTPDKAREISTSSLGKVNMDNIKWILRKVEYKAGQGKFLAEIPKNAVNMEDIEYIKKMGYKISDSLHFYKVNW